MAKGKATKASKAKSSEKRGAPEKPKLPKSKEAPKAAAATKTAKPEARAAAPAPEATPPAATAAAGGIKKKNVKRGAPPMLPRRMVRRPEPGAEGAAPAGPPPPPRLVAQPGSLHAPARQPEGADQLKQRLTTVMNLLNQLRGLKRTLNRQFYEAGLVLQKLSDPALYQAKGYGSFEKFVEREVERELTIGRSVAHDLVQIVRVFQREAAEELGLERLRNALRTLWPEPGPQTASSAPVSSG